MPTQRFKPSSLFSCKKKDLEFVINLVQQKFSSNETAYEALAVYFMNCAWTNKNEETNPEDNFETYFHASLKGIEIKCYDMWQKQSGYANDKPGKLMQFYGPQKDNVDLIECFSPVVQTRCDGVFQDLMCLLLRALCEVIVKGSKDGYEFAQSLLRCGVIMSEIYKQMEKAQTEIMLQGKKHNVARARYVEHALLA